MGRRVTFHWAAEAEFHEAIAFYDLERPGLGADFGAEVERCTRSIASNPFAGQRVTRQVRRRLLQRFPFALLYSVRAREVRVLAVMHLHRRPFYWHSRS